MKVRATKVCFIGHLREVGEVFDYDGPAADWLVPVDPVAAKPEPAPAPKPEIAPRENQAKRDEDIASALDLLDEHDFVRTGARAGAPKCSAIENIVGYPVFIDEVDAAWRKRPR